MTTKIIPVPKNIKKDLTGQTFGDWTVVKEVGNSNSKERLWLCRCSCGRERKVFQANLTRGLSLSCGYRASHGSHGMAKTGEYKSWHAMIQRCGNPAKDNYASYGGRGIKVCERWLNSFEAFYTDMGPRPKPEYSLDRIDPNGDYEPKNCRWATSKQQQNNMRSNLRITYQGQTMTVEEWAERMGLPAPTIRKRLRLGWEVKRALTTPITLNKSHRK